MEEVRQLPWNGYRVVSTFSGAGGSCLGYRMAGFRVVWASEFVPAAQEVYKLNHPDSYLSTEDIRDVSPEDILRQAGVEQGEIDILDGSPPCASFSLCGKREKGWGDEKRYSDTRQRADDLFWEYARILRGLQPKVFVAENVRGLVIGKAKGMFLEILRLLEGCGYTVSARVLDAQWLGVPQTRARLIFVGTRADLAVEPAHPRPFERRISISEACPWILGNEEHPSDEAGLLELGDTAVGGEWDKLGWGQASEKYFQAVRAHPYRPSPCVTASGGSSPGIAAVLHPTERRKFSIPELKRICGFPDDFVLTGNFGKQWERLGRSVPPLMMKAVAETVRDEVLAKAVLR